MQHAIEVDRVSKTFRTGGPLPFLGGPRRDIHALIDVSLVVQTGEIFGLVGRNGYGKTTLIKCIASLVQPSSGGVRVLGHDSVHDGRALRRAIGLVSAEERTFYFRLTGRQNLVFFGRLQGVRGPELLARIAELGRLFDIEPLLDRAFHQYSTGNRQRLAVVRALLHNPRLLLLDEPTRSLDPFAAASLRRVLTEWVKADAGRTVLISTHNLSEVEEVSDRVGIMSRGRMRQQGTLAELRQEHGSYELVEVGLEAELDAGLLDAVKRRASQVELARDPERGFSLKFRRVRNDRVLDAVLRELVGGGAVILGVRQSELSLQDIVDRVEAEGSE